LKNYGNEHKYNKKEIYQISPRYQWGYSTTGPPGHVTTQPTSEKHTII